MQRDLKSIQIPIMNVPGEYIKFFPDELPEDPYDVIDVLRSELAPLKIWRTCAIEYMKQGSEDGFNVILQDIVENLRDPTLEDLYTRRDDYAEGITDIFLAFAAKELISFSKAKLSTSSIELIQSTAKRCIDYIKLADEKLRIYEYTWFIKGFYEMVSGDYKRAEEHFRNIHERATKGNISKKKFTFVSYIGLGMVAYANSKFSNALEHFSKAVEYYPDCHASVRTAIACCCYKLQEYERAKLTVQRGIKLDPSDVNYLILSALLELIQARKDRNNRAQLKQNSYEYLYLARQMDGTNSIVLNLLANHSFHSWRRVDSSFYFPIETSDSAIRLVDGNKLIISKPKEEYSKQLSNLLEIGNQLRLSNVAANKSTVHLIVSVQQSHVDGFDVTEISFTPSVSAAQHVVPLLEIKHLKQVVDDASKALLYTSLALIRTESYYLLGKVAHAQGNSSQAYDFYRLALKEFPENVLAAFGAAQILFTRQDYKNALDLFEKVLKKYPDDKDTLAYIILLKGKLNEEIVTFERLREIVPGFQFEIDIWLMQGQLYHKKLTNNNDYGIALKCYLQAKEWYQQEEIPVPSHVLNNLAILYQLLMKYDKAIEFMQKVLRSFAVTAHSSYDAVTLKETQRQLRQDGLNTILFCNSNYENAFYEWDRKNVCCYVKQHHDRCDLFSLQIDNAVNDISISLQDIFVVGEQIIINDMIWVIEEFISPTEMTCFTIFRSKTYRIPLTDNLQHNGLPVFQKYIYGNINDETFSYSYNYARILEDSGNLFAAKHIYVNLIQLHPSFVDNYMRLSIIARQLHHYEEALEWVQKAKNVYKGDSVGIELALGDVYMLLGQSSEAKKHYENIYTKNRKDSQVLLTMGNYHYSLYVQKRDDRKVDRKDDKKDDKKEDKKEEEIQNQLKLAYKFYFPILSENTHNIYAANGLGIVCAEKKENDAAREIFSKIRQANLPNTEEVDTNFANIHILEKRYGEAERVYLSSYKNLLKSSAVQLTQPVTTDIFLQLLQNMAFTQFQSQRYEEALKSIFKAWHFHSSSDILHSALCFNVISIVERLVNNQSEANKKTNRSSDDLETSMALSKLIIKLIHTMLLHYSAKDERSNYLTKPSVIEGLSLKEKYQSHKESYRALHTQLQLVKIQEAKLCEDRKRYEEDHLLKKRLAEEEKQRQSKELEEKKKEALSRAQDKEKKLEELKLNWNSSAKPDGEAAGGGAKRKRRLPTADEDEGRKRKPKRRSTKAKKSDDEEDDEEEADENNYEDDAFLNDGPDEVRAKERKGGLKKRKQGDDGDDDNDDNINSWSNDIGDDLNTSKTAFTSQLDMVSDDDDFLNESSTKDEVRDVAKSKEVAGGGRLKKNKVVNELEDEDDEVANLFD